MAKIKFERVSSPVGSIEFSINPVFGDYKRSYNHLQPKTFTAGGVFYSYNKGLKRTIISLEWATIPASEYEAFIVFLDDIAKGSHNTFIFTDFEGNTHTARILNANEIDSEPVRHEQETFEVVLLLES